jgi:hypothetical protein
MREIFMSNAIEALRDKLTVFAKQKNEIALVTKMLGEVDEMKNSGISADTISYMGDICSIFKLWNLVAEPLIVLFVYEKNLHNLTHNVRFSVKNIQVSSYTN